jgi:hypothetical protein
MTSTAEKPRPAPTDWFGCLGYALFYYSLTSVVVVLGVVFGNEFVERPGAIPFGKRGNALAAFARWDGEWYTRIVTEGYTQSPEGRRATVFFPAYPLLGRCLAWATGWRPEMALLVVSHICLVVTFVLAGAYSRLRFPAPDHAAIPGFVLLALGLFPPSCFFRMAYTESPFLLLTVLVFYGMERRWPLGMIAVLVGAASSVRAVGVALAPAFAVHLWQRSPRMASFVWRIAVLGPPTCWGILVYMLYQQAAFGDPLLFFHAESGYRLRPEESMGQKVWSDITLEPIWSVFNPNSPGYWVRWDLQRNPLFSLFLANPLYLLGAMVLLTVGVRKHWLNGSETTAALFLLLIPYVSKGGAIYMAGMARFVAGVFPLYLVLGRLLTGLPAPVAAACAALSAVFLGAYSALFAAWHAVF